MASLIFVTQRIDQNDPTLGFVPSWVAALAARVDRVDVIANEVAPDAASIADNVRVIGLGKQEGASRFRRGIAFEQAVWDLTRRGDVLGLVAHMCPIYLDLAFPIAKLRRIPTLLWFAHPSKTWTLRLANLLADGVITSLPGAYPLPGAKVHVIGQAIDLDSFEFSPLVKRDDLSLVAVGRTSSAKGLGTMVRAVALLRRAGQDLQLRIIGSSSNAMELRHRHELERIIEAEGVRDCVSLEPGVPPSEVPRLLRDADGLLNGMVNGSGDKVVFEAAATGRPAIASNRSFTGLLGDLPIDLLFDEGNPAQLADRIAGLSNAPWQDRLSVAQELRARVEQGHSVQHWARATTGLLERMHSRG
jgi:glycosyltransferase involved in cell wall biosynthesis